MQGVWTRIYFEKVAKNYLKILTLHGCTASSLVITKIKITELIFETRHTIVQYCRLSCQSLMLHVNWQYIYWTVVYNPVKIVSCFLHVHEYVSHGEPNCFHTQLKFRYLQSLGLSVIPDAGTSIMILTSTPCF